MSIERSGEFGLGSGKTDLADGVAQDIIGYLIEVAGGETLFAQIFAHAYELSALPRK